jgi:transcriptional regulator with XRE-family HTH domain
VAVIGFMITARQSRAARALLGWNQETLAEKARVSLTALKRLESESELRVYESTRDQVRRALEANGIVLLTTDRGEGVMVMRGAIAEDRNKRL